MFQSAPSQQRGCRGGPAWVFSGGGCCQRDDGHGGDARDESDALDGWDSTVWGGGIYHGFYSRSGSGRQTVLTSLILLGIACSMCWSSRKGLMASRGNSFPVFHERNIQMAATCSRWSPPSVRPEAIFHQDFLIPHGCHSVGFQVVS